MATVLNDYNRQFERDIGHHILNHLNFNIKRRETLKATHPTIFWRRHWKQSANDSLRDVLIQWMYTHTQATHTNAKSFAITLTFFSETSLEKLSQLSVLCNNGDRWGNLHHVRKNQSHPAAPHCWLARNFFSGQSEAGISSTSGTDLVRVSAQGLFSILW